MENFLKLTNKFRTFVIIFPYQWQFFLLNDQLQPDGRHQWDCQNCRHQSHKAWESYRLGVSWRSPAPRSPADRRPTCTAGWTGWCWGLRTRIMLMRNLLLILMLSTTTTTTLLTTHLMTSIWTSYPHLPSTARHRTTSGTNEIHRENYDLWEPIGRISRTNSDTILSIISKSESVCNVEDWLWFKNLV